MTALLAVSSSWVVGWSVVFHLASDHHHDGTASDHRVALGPEMALHGHAHPEGTPAHRHPFVGTAAAPIPGKLLLLIGAKTGDVPEVVLAETSGRRFLARAGPTHDPPLRPDGVCVLRI